MITTQLDNRIYSINIPLPGNPLKNLNSFLIRGERRNLLIDTGFNMPECLEAMQGGLSELNIDMSKTDIFLTHLHSDHIGLASSIADDNSTVYINPVDKERMLRFKTDEYRARVDARFLRYGFPPEQLKENITKNPALIYLPSREIEYSDMKDGDVIDLGNRLLHCIVTPGHTPGHTCLYDPEEQFLFCGDCILFGITPNITSWSGMDDSLGSYLGSLEKLKSLPVRRAFVSHRQIEGDIYKRIDELKEHHRRRLDECLNILRTLEEATVYQVAARMTWSIKAKNWEDFPVAQKWFAVGEAHAHLEHLSVHSAVRRSDDKEYIIYAAF